MHQILTAAVASLLAVSLDSPAAATASSAQLDVTARAEQLAESLVLARDRGHREPVWVELVALARDHDEVRPVLAQALVALFDKANKRMDTRPTRHAFEGLIEDRRRLDELRVATLALVRDKVRYPYPYAVPEATADEARAYAESQRRIDENVAAMRQLWTNGADASLTRALRRGGERILWARSKAAWLHENLSLDVALESPNVPEWMHSLPVERPDKKVDLQTFALTPAEARRIAHDSAVVQRNATLFGALRQAASPAEARARVDLEWDQVVQTNEYRRMLGLSALALNRRLYQAVRNHAAYLAAVGHLGHTQDVPEYSTIRERAHSFGYDGPVWENCHSGSTTAKGALIAWTRSSAHHRTILTAKLTEMATGFAENTWVQKFGLDTGFESEIQCHPWRD